MAEDADALAEQVSAVQINNEAEADGLSDDDFGEFNDDSAPASFVEAHTSVDEPGDAPTALKDAHLPSEHDLEGTADALSDTQGLSETRARGSDTAYRQGPKPLRIADIPHLTRSEIQEKLTTPPVVPGSALARKYDEELGDGTTPTSQTLWQHLTEQTWMPLPKWEGSPIHRQLVVNLGIPLNLDATLPRPAAAAKGNMHLPTQIASNGVEGTQHIPEWTLLSEVSAEALQSMSESELEAHVDNLQTVLDKAHALKDAMESKEMDLVGEKNILEGMVESLLIFSQRKQRERLQRKASKSRK